jgi:hypothetical protein
MAGLAGVGAGLSLAGSVGHTVANIRSSTANARGLEYEARSIEDQTAFDVTQERRRQRILQGQGNAITAASGLDPTSGSPLLMELDRVRQGELEVQSLKRAGDMAITTRRYGAQLTRREIPYMILGGMTGGATPDGPPGVGSILTRYMMARSSPKSILAG